MTRRRPGRRDRALALIAVFKFCKAALLAAVGLAALELLQPAFGERASQALEMIAMKTNAAMAQRPVSWISGLSERRLEVLAIAAFLYAALFVVEGIGLWQERRWAEYLTVVATSSLVPFEVYELARRVTPARVGSLVINLAVVGYLIYRLKHPSKAAFSSH